MAATEAGEVAASGAALPAVAVAGMVAVVDRSAAAWRVGVLEATAEAEDDRSAAEEAVPQTAAARNQQPAKQDPHDEKTEKARLC